MAAMDTERITNETSKSKREPEEKMDVVDSGLIASGQSLFDDGVEIEEVRPQEAIKIFDQVLELPDPRNELHKLKEDSIMHLGTIYAKLGRAEDLKRLFLRSRPFFNLLAKSRVGKIVRSLIDVVGSIKISGGTSENALEVQAETCRDAIEWCETERRTFLKQKIQAKLSAIYLLQHKYNESLAIISRLVRAVKKFDDKLLLVEIELVESRVHLALSNVPKAKGALTAARSSANAIYCPPATQAEIDMQAGILCAAEEDFRTAFSYFYESFEGYNTIKDSANAIRALKYMLLSKVMLSQYEDVYQIINGKAGVKYAGVEMEAMRAVADAYKARSVENFEAIYNKYDEQLNKDVVISSHLQALRDQLLEKNLIRLVEPFSRVQLDHVAKLIKLPPNVVEAKLSEMILDKKLNGILDQGSGDLLVFEPPKQDKTYVNGIETIKELNAVVDKLYQKAKRLTH